MSNTIKWSVPGISCQHCAMAIKRALAPLPGITAVTVDAPGKTVAFEASDEQWVSRARAALEEIGYPPAAS